MALSAPTPVSNQKTSLMLWAAGAVVVIWGLIEAKAFLVPVIVAALLALTLMPLIRGLKKLRFPEWLAVMIASLVLILPFIGLASIIASESQSLIHDWPQLKEKATAEFHALQTSSWAAKYHVQDRLKLDEISSQIGERASQGVTVAFLGLSMLFSAGSKIVLVVFFAIMMLSAREHLRTGFERILARSRSFREAAVLEASMQVLEQFLAARLMIILFVAVADFAILGALGVPYAVSLALLQGLMTLIPAVGFVLGLIPVAIIAIAQGDSALLTLGILAAIWAVSSFQDHFLTPKLIGQKLNLNFFITYLALFAGERMWGIWGMFLAIPILGVARIILNATESGKPWGQLIQERAEEGEGVTEKASSKKKIQKETPAQKRLDEVTSY